MRTYVLPVTYFPRSTFLYSSVSTQKLNQYVGVLLSTDFQPRHFPRWKHRSRLLNPPSTREVFLALEGHPTLREENWSIQEMVSNVSTKIHRIRRGQLSPLLSPATNTQHSISCPILPHFSVASITFGRIECDSKNWPGGGVNHSIEITSLVV